MSEEKTCKSCVHFFFNKDKHTVGLCNNYAVVVMPEDTCKSAIDFVNELYKESPEAYERKGDVK